MQKHVVVFLFCCFTLALQAQTYYPSFSSVDYLRSGVLTGSERDRYYSMRMYSLGLGFQGMIEDQLTDLYRNPAYFNKNEKQHIWGDVLRGTLGSKTLSSTGLRLPTEPIIMYYPYNDLELEKIAIDYNDYFYGTSLYQYYYYPQPRPITTSSSGVRFGYAGQFGILAHLNHSSSINQTNSETEGLDYNNSFRKQKTVGTYSNDINGGDVQVSYGLSLSHDISLGVSYTFAYDESPSLQDQDNFYISSRRYEQHTTDSNWNAYSNHYNTARKGASHIFKAGLLSETENTTFEAIATVDLTSSEYSNDMMSNSQSVSIYESYYYSGSVIIDTGYSLYRNTQQSNYHDGYDADITNIRLDFRYARTLETQNTFSARLGFGVGYFSATETMNGINASRRWSSYQYQNQIQRSSEYYDNSTTTYGLMPDGLGFQINGGVAWGFHVKDWYLLIGGTAYATQNTFDFDNRREIDQITQQMYLDTVYIARSLSNNTLYHHKNTIGTIQIALPIGMEYELVENCFVRAGWELSYLRKVDKDQSVENGRRYVSDRINTQRVSLGLGVTIIDDLHVDFLSKGNIAEPNNWNLQIIYSL